MIGSGLGTVAEASKARLEALGQGADGSYFINDNRNIFLNPATIIGMNNQLNIEVGNNGGVNPKAEGGLIHSNEVGTFGLHLGRLGMGAQNISRAETDLTYVLFNPQNSVELFFGRDLGGFNVGASLLYSNSKSDTGETVNLPDDKASVMTMKVGTHNDSFGAFFAYSINEESKTEDLASVIREYEATSSMKLGGVYNLNDNLKLSAQVTQLDFKFNNGAGLTGTSGQQDLVLNMYNHLVGDKEFFVFYTVGITQAKQTKDYDTVSANDVEESQMYLPLAIGAEAQVKDWLTLRASVKQNTLIDNTELKNAATDLKTSNLDDTVISAGLGLHFGKVTIDGLLEGARSGTGNISGNSFLANASLNYSY